MSVNPIRPPGGEDLMAGGNFDPVLRIDGGTGIVKWPSGPLFPAAGETMVRVEVWVMQKATGAIQITYQDTFPNAPTSWKADKWSAPYYWGVFRAGPALGTAVAISTPQANVFEHYWWSEEVELKVY
jgi:hypothetical protein